MLLDLNIRDVNSPEGREFRRRFRLPAPFFLDWLVPQCKEANLFSAKLKLDGESMGHIPTEIKILIALRILARENVADDIAEMSSVGRSTCSNIFRHPLCCYSHYSYFLRRNRYQPTKGS